MMNATYKNEGDISTFEGGLHTRVLNHSYIQDQQAFGAKHGEPFDHPACSFPHIEYDNQCE